MRSFTAKEHTASVLALCLSVFAQSYLLISVFPYSGYMAIDLLEGVNGENVGSYAGLLASSFMLGRALTSYGWGKLADRYGRVPVLQASLVLSLVFSFLFGLSTSFALALLIRFFLGIGSGILIVAKVSASELACGSQVLETKGMGMVMGMWAMGYMIAPAISGALAEPTRQYPDHVRSAFLAEFPFFLPNLVGAILCLMSILTVHVYVKETLPEDKLRHFKHLPNDTWSSIRSVYNAVLPTIEESTLIAPEIPASYGGTESDDESDIDIPQHVLDFIQHDVGDAIRESQLACDESVAFLSTTNPRASIAQSIARRSTISSGQRRISRLSHVSSPATVSSLWAQTNTRNHMVVYWIASFVMVAVDEGFPLFCISQVAGLGLSEGSIGKIMSASGLLFVVGQYFIYTMLVNWAGLYGSIRIGSLSMGPLVALLPISLWLNKGSSGEDTLTWQAFTFLSIILAIYRVFSLSFFSSMAVAMNRTVLPSHRGTMNGLSTVGGSIAKGLGPIFAGVLVAFSFSSGVFAPHVGAVFMWVVMSGLGCVATVAAFLLLHDDDEEDAIELNT